MMAMWPAFRASIGGSTAATALTTPSTLSAIYRRKPSRSIARISNSAYMPAPSRARSIGPSSRSILPTVAFSSSGLSASAGYAVMLPLDAASAVSASLDRAVAATVTPAEASRFAISPQIAPDAPVIHATFHGKLCAILCSRTCHSRVSGNPVRRLARSGLLDCPVAPGNDTREILLSLTSIHEGIVHEDGVLSLRTCREERNRGADQLLEAAHIFDALRRQLGPRPRAARRFAPALHRLVDRLDAGLRPLRRGQMVELASVEPVAHANLELWQLVENVELGQRYAVDAAHFARLAHEACIEPAATARAPRDRAELDPALADQPSRLVLELGRERPLAHPRRICLGDAENIVDGAGPEPRSGRGLSRNRVRRGDERIGAVIDVEQSPLRALEQDALALPPLGVEQRPHRIDIRQDLRRDLRQLGAERIGGNLGLAQTFSQGIVVGEDALDLGLERGEVLKVHHPDGTPPDLVLVSRADAALGGPDPPVSGRTLAQRIELAVERQDQRCILGDAEIVAGDADPELLHLGDLLGQSPGVDHHAIADDRELALAHHARGQERELVGHPVDHERMAGIVAALEAHHDIGALGQPIDDLALAFVAPLRADDHDIGHVKVLRFEA